MSFNVIKIIELSMEMTTLVSENITIVESTLYCNNKTVQIQMLTLKH